MDSFTIPEPVGFTITPNRAVDPARILLAHATRRAILISDGDTLDELDSEMLSYEAQEYVANLDPTPADYLEYIEHVAPGRVTFGPSDFGETVFRWAIDHGYASALVVALLRKAQRYTVEVFPDISFHLDRDELLVGIVLNYLITDGGIRGGLFLRDGEVTVHT